MNNLYDLLATISERHQDAKLITPQTCNGNRLIECRAQAPSELRQQNIKQVVA
jgi:hypothetical protein